MKAKEVFDHVGTQLAEAYKHLGFKYTKTWGLKKETTDYQYRVSFNSAEGNTKTRVSLFVNIFIHCKRVKNSWNDPVTLFHINLWELGYYYEVGESHSLEEVFQDICKHVDVLLIPFIDIFENHAHEYEDQWVKQGFLGHIQTGLYKYPFLDYMTHKHYWIDTPFVKEHNEFGFTISLRYIFDIFGRVAAEKCLNNYYQSMNKESQDYFLQAYYAYKRSTTEPWECTYQTMPDIDMVHYSADQDLKIHL